MRQLLFVVETNSSNLSDDRYINRLIGERYDLSSNDVKIQFVHMCGKTNYRNSSVLTQINNYLKTNRDGDNYVLYCFDTDRIDCNQEDKRQFEMVKAFCKSNKYYLIWFDYNIEYVLLGKNVESNMKKKEASKFYRNKKVAIPVERLFCTKEELRGHSNIYAVLDSLLKIMQK